MRLKIAALLVLAVLAMGVAAAAMLRPMTSAPAAPDATTTKPIAKAVVPELLVIGDSYTGGSNEGGFKEAGWPMLVQAGYTKDGARLQLNLLARGGAGYVTPGQINETFQQSYSGNQYKDQDVVVVFGGLNDASAPADAVGSAAAALYADLRKQSPDAALIVIGPAWPNAAPIPNMLKVRDAIEAAATGAGATFIDPLAEGWFTGDAAALIGADKTHPTDAGHKYIAEKLAPPITAAVKKALAGKQ